MMRGILFLVLLLVASPVGAVPTTTTLFLDGAMVEQQVDAPKGHAQVRLPAGMLPGSLRVRPLPGAVIQLVEVVPVAQSQASRKEEARLVERKEQIADRLRALETREEIFRAAAKSQSGKAPRKTKANPQPLATIRQGTDYALSQLEEVYRLRRKSEKELKDADRQLARLRLGNGSGGSIVRISVSGRTKAAIVSYHRSDLSWAPRYDFRLRDGRAEAADLTVKPKIPAGAAGKILIAAARLADFDPGKTVRDEASSRSVAVPVERVAYIDNPLSSVSFTLKNNGSSPLPAGEASVYWQGEYVGTIPFAGCGPGESRDVAAGAGNSGARQGTP